MEYSFPMTAHRAEQIFDVLNEGSSLMLSLVTDLVKVQQEALATCQENAKLKKRVEMLEQAIQITRGQDNAVSNNS